MSNSLKPPDVAAVDGVDHVGDELRLLSRSPHPYHRQRFEILEPSDHIVSRASSIPAQSTGTGAQDQVLPSAGFFTKEATPSSDSGTEADDEHFLKGLPAPKARLHKGLRGKNDTLSGASTPLLSPAILEDSDHKIPVLEQKEAERKNRRDAADRKRQRKECIRRSTELVLLVFLGSIVGSNPDASMLVKLWRKGESSKP